MKLNELVKTIIQNNKISKQTDITDILLSKYNIDITQSNISRILKNINAVKTVNNKEVVYEIQEKLTAVSAWTKKLIRNIDDNGQLILIESHPGSASIIGQALDEIKLDNIMGTLAGDNVLLVIPKDISKIKELREKIEKGFY
jgi:transcriptional regulator of arginine metabolism